MSAEPADRQNPTAEDTVRLSAVSTTAGLTSIARYKILSELGRGAMARVYLALDPNIHRKVALKVLEPRGLVSAIDEVELRTRFLLEARAAGNLRHPSAVAIYDADHDLDTGLSFIAMEWVDGQSLDNILRQDTRITTDRAISIICQVAEALDAAHCQGLIHRDVKPGNILLDSQGNAKLSDFGIAKAESLDLTSTGQILGTPSFMSPEQILDKELDGRSDLFSLGIVLYRSLTGQLPFHADSLPALTHKILHVDPAPPQSHAPSLPQPLASTMLKALEKDPDNRYQSGAELVQALRQSQQPVTETVSLTHPSLHAADGAPEPTVPSKSRGRGRILRNVLLTLIAIAIFSGIQKNKPTPEVPARQVQTEAAVPELAPNPTEAISRADPNPSSVAITGSTLQVSYTNRLKSATLDVWVDGDHVLAKPVYGPRGMLKRAAGQTHLESIPVSPGHHSVKVSIRGSAGKIEASNWASSTFDEGQTRRLRVELIPPTFLKLAWK